MIKKCKDYQTISEFIDDELSNEEKEITQKHLKECEECKTIYESFTNIDKKTKKIFFDKINIDIDKQKSTILRKDLKAAAGHEEIGNLDKGLVSCLPENAMIVCQSRQDGYMIRIEGSIPIKLGMVFFKNKSKLLEIEISEQLPKKLVDLESIRGWTHINIFRIG